ncbi:homoserine O-succinyltransferase [Rhodovibrio salinarum]|uniref:Homoserine O-acetyltransferase n=1 Tax=Rhodovibrio salinarum TaxID=1087 RepID=A0A934QI48_9PROT|nr:homoserine O-succinyltransferase [Rhodovibrio salinarum]MBK1697416.1 homoserine O-succinyltransferase [Rhodovibrio salinarum]
MPIKIPDNSPAERILEDEGIELIRTNLALRQDIRPMRVLLLNLMPSKISTEVQLARLLSHTPLQVELTLLTTASYAPKHTKPEHLKQFYNVHKDVADQYFDALVITGSPVEQLPFENVDYWSELREILEWSSSNVFRRLHLCWAAQAGLYLQHGIDKRVFPEKLFGVFPQQVLANRELLLRGFPDRFWCPVSRYADVAREDILASPDLDILADSEESGVCLVADRQGRDVYMLNHLEYDTETLGMEYHRDRNAGRATGVPKNYFPNDDPNQPPINSWRPFAYLFFSNWMYKLYEDTPFDLQELAFVPALATE